jgi:hypothetical protein
MKIALWSCAAVGVFVLAVTPCLAQEKGPAPKELPKLSEIVPPTPTLAEEHPGCGASCYPPCDKYFDLLFMDYACAISALYFEDVVVQEKRKTMEIYYKEEDRKVPVYVMRSRPIKRECPCTRMVEETKTDCHGNCYTTLCPVTEMRVEEDTEYFAVLQDQTIKVKVPYVREITVNVPHRTTVFAYRPEVRTKQYIMKIPAKPFPQDQIIFPPKLPCETPMEMIGAPVEVPKTGKSPETGGK